MPLITRRLDRFAYYATNILRDTSPQFIFRKRINSILTWPDAGDQNYIRDRVHYYNKLKPGVTLGTDAVAVASISMSNSFYYYDLKEHARYFSRSLRLNYQFGDVIH